MNERIARLRAKNLTQQPEICSERAQIVTRAYEKYKDLPPLLLRAKTFEAIMQEMTIWIADDELIVGNQAKGQGRAGLSGILRGLDHQGA